MALSLVTAPTQEPISLEEMKLYLRVDHDYDDDLISALITASRIEAETIQRRQLVRADWLLTLDHFPCWEILLKLPPIIDINSITYINTAGVETVLDSDDYLLDNKSEPGRLTPAYGLYWPSTRCQVNAVEIEFTAGYGDPDDVPVSTKTGIKQLVVHWYENRGDSSMPRHVENLLMAERWGAYP